MARLRKDQAATSPSFAGIREQLNLRVSQAPQDAILLTKLAILDALLNNKETAITEAKRASEILPISKDAVDGELKRDPWWEPLRQDTRYNKLLAELAPKD
jgi:hypothetical protein